MQHTFDSCLTVHAPRTVVMGVTGSWAFAAATVLLAFRRHNPSLDTDFLLFCDDSLADADARILQCLGAQILPFAPVPAAVNVEALRIFSPLCLAKFACFDLLDRYSAIVWLDADVVIQDALDALFDSGPLALAVEDPDFSIPPGTKPAGINFHEAVEGVDGEADNLNSGIIVFSRELPNPRALHEQCLDFLRRHGPNLRYPDQAVFNHLAQRLAKKDARLIHILPQRFNTHPRNPQATYAPIVHAFGAYKLWNDGLTAACFPEWLRDYEKWKVRGGSPYQGPIENSRFLEGGAFSLLGGLYETITKAERTIEDLRKKLAFEANARMRLEKTLGELAKKIR